MLMNIITKKAALFQIQYLNCLFGISVYCGNKSAFDRSH